MSGVTQMDMGGPTHMQLTNEEKEAREQDRLLPIANIRSPKGEIKRNELVIHLDEPNSDCA